MQLIDEGECIDPVENTVVSLFVRQREQHIKPQAPNDETEVVVDPYTTGNGKDQSQQMSHAEILQYAKSSPDSGRNFTLDNIDIHQATHDMTQDHHNPDAHYCTLMSTENRISGNSLQSHLHILCCIYNI